jgi:hypothetical protein
MTRFIINHKWSIAFWLVNFFGWTGVQLIGYLFTPNIDGFKDSNFFLWATVSGILLGVLVSGIMRWALKQYVSFDKFDLFNIVKSLIVFILGTWAFALGGLGAGILIEESGVRITNVPDFYKDMGLGIVFVNAFILIFGWGIIYVIVKLVIKFNADRVERLKINSQLKQAQLNTLKGQINPHFMFNSLNNIRGLMLEDVEKSREMLTKLSEMLRYSLTKNNVNAITLEEELEMVHHYIALSKIQFEDRLIYEENIDDTLRSTNIPPMLIQLLVENAAKHGISKLKNGGKIQLNISRNTQEMLLEVRNTGSLQFDSNSTHLGLKNIKQRLFLLYGKVAKFDLEAIDQEVIATIKIPLA